MSYFTLNANSYNDFTCKIRNMMVDVATVKAAGTRYKIYDHNNNVVATYDERKNHGLVYNYNTHSEITNKVLTF